MIRDDIRNLCIIAHVDHGKTTLVDHLLQQAGAFAAHEEVSDRVMDSGDLEKERGITILAKNTSVVYEDTKINIVDTPGHADFGGEVERILGTVDGAVLLVDAAEGPLPQTRFVLSKALAMGHRVILCINKVDRQEVQGTNRIQEVVDKTFDLFVELGATDEQCEFPIVYACARDGWCTENEDELPQMVSKEKKGDLKPLFDLMLKTIHGPDVAEDVSFKMQLSNLGWSEYVGQLSIGRVVSGCVERNQEIFCLGVDDKGQSTAKKFLATRLYAFDGLKQVEVQKLSAGEIGVVAGCNEVFIGDTLVGDKGVAPFERIAVDAPTIRMIFSINTGPKAGLEGEAIQSRGLRDRLLREVRANVALKYEEGDSPDQFFLLGRGELQFSILIEQMRREGYEFMVGRPVVVYKNDDAGNKLEPIETATLDIPEQFSGEVTEMLQTRKGILVSYEPQTSGRLRLVFDVPSRGLLGIRSRFLTLTRGEGLMSSELKGYEEFKGDMLHRKNGSLVADRAGKTTEYSLSTLEDRGVMFLGPGVEVYEGMIIGECARENDINVNPTKEKKLTNVRKTGSDGLTILSGIRKLTLEMCIEWLEEDEWIEITPENIRLRKKILAQNQRSVIRGKKKS